MTTEFKSLPVEWKAADDDSGIVEAVVSVFGNVDYGGDRVIKGAFAATLAEWAKSGDPIPFIWSHDWNDPNAHIGYVTDAKEIAEGLYVKAQIDTDRPFAQQVHHLLKSRRVKEFSFGYGVKEWAYVDEDGQSVRELKTLDLYECGPCLLGMNDSTRLISAASRDLHLALGGKSGRVLSSKNESALKNARDLLDGVLASVDAQVEDDGKNITPEGGKQADLDPRDTPPTIDTVRLAEVLART